MQTPASPQPPAPPAPPADAPPAPPPPPAGVAQGTPASTNPFTVTLQNLPVPRSEAEVSALRSRGSELSRQLQSAQRRRDEVARDLRRTDGADRAGLEQRLQLLDQRILGIETDIAANGRLLAAAPPALLASTSEPSVADRSNVLDLSSGQMTAIAIVFNIFVLAPLAFAYAQRLLRRPMRSPQTPAAIESQQRLERMEQAVDAIAIEVERVSESQRFLTRILTEARELPALGGRPNAEPARASEAAGARS